MGEKKTNIQNSRIPVHAESGAAVATPAIVLSGAAATVQPVVPSLAAGIASVALLALTKHDFECSRIALVWRPTKQSY